MSALIFAASNGPVSGKTFGFQENTQPAPSSHAATSTSHQADTESLRRCGSFLATAKRCVMGSQQP